MIEHKLIYKTCNETRFFINIFTRKKNYNLKNGKKMAGKQVYEALFYFIFSCLRLLAIPKLMN